MTPGLGAGLPGIGNNIVVAHHLGIEGHLGQDLSYRLLGTYSRNYGAANKVCRTPRCGSPTSRRTGRLDQWSFRAEIRGRLPGGRGLFYRVAPAADMGAFYEDRMGLSLDLTWRRPLGR